MAVVTAELSLIAKVTVASSSAKKMSSNEKFFVGSASTDVQQILVKLSQAISSGQMGDIQNVKSFYLQDAAVSNYATGAVGFQQKGIADFYKTHEQVFTNTKFLLGTVLYTTDKETYIVAEGQFQTLGDGAVYPYKIVFKDKDILYHTVNYKHAPI